MIQEELSKKILNSYFTVYNTLGHGFLEKVYENALVIELKRNDLPVVSQMKLEVFYFGDLVGEYYPDLCVNSSVIIELKACEHLAPEHEGQLINYLKASTIEVGFLFNFGPKPEFRRRILTNDCKGYK